MCRPAGYWLRLARLALVALVAGVVGCLVGFGLTTSARYAQALTHPGCVETGVDARDVSPVAVIDRISPRPLLLIYGDREVGAARPREQFARAEEPKALWIVPDCGHGGYLDAAPEAWERRVVAFFDRSLLQGE